MKFAISYSCGKDSALALLRMKNDGHEPVCMITTINESAGRSWFHGVDYELLEDISDSLGIPLVKCLCDGDNYHTEFEKCLSAAAAMGAEACVFGDIDIDDHLEWNRKRCEAAGLECVLPLWKQSREALAYETVDTGIKAIIKCVQSDILDDSFLGETLTRELIGRISETGADICGENGEYHTLVYDGPVFQYPVKIKLADIIDFGTHSVIDIRSDR